jgi:hypothetical protein
VPAIIQKIAKWSIFLRELAWFSPVLKAWYNALLSSIKIVASPYVAEAITRGREDLA